jgi:SET domain-containing protein
MAARKPSKLKLLPGRGRSKLCVVRESPIHGRGVYATRQIRESTRIIEYVGEKISKEESDRRGTLQLERAQATGEAGVYIFTLDDQWDMDGDFEENIARLINHSCDPNCEAYLEHGRIWIWSIRNIEEGEELLFNYGFDLENYQDHPCRCGSSRCPGYIAGEEYWPELQRILTEKRAQGEKLPAPGA